MKGECDGRELAPGAPVRVGAGVFPEHSKEEASGKIETGVKGEKQDGGTRSFQMPAVVGGNQDNCPRGFTVAELTKVGNVSSSLGNLQIPSVQDGAIGSYRVPSFREDYPGRPLANLGETTNILGWSDNRTIGAFKVPGFKGEDSEHSGALDLTRVNLDITSGNLEMAGVKEDGHSGNKTSSMTQQMEEGHSSTKVAPTQDSVAGSGTLIGTKRETPKSAAERNCLAASKRLNHYGVGMKPLEAVIRRLKQDACAAMSTTNVVDSIRTTEQISMSSSDVAAVKRLSQDGASEMLGPTAVKRMRQDITPETADVMPIIRENQNIVTETVNGACIKNLSQDRLSGTEGGATMEEERQYIASAETSIEDLSHDILTNTAGRADIDKEQQDSVFAKADVQNLNQDTPTNTAGGAAVEKEGQDSVFPKACIKSLSKDRPKSTAEEAVIMKEGTSVLAKAHVKNLSQDRPVSSGGEAMEKERQDSIIAKEDVSNLSQDIIINTESGENFEKERQDSASIKVDAKKLNQGVGVEFVQMGAMKIEKENSAIWGKDSEMKECFKDNSSKSSAQPEIQEEHKNTVSVSQIQPTVSSSVPDKDIHETTDEISGNLTESCIKNETEDSPVKKSLLASKKEQDKDTKKEKPQLSKQESDETIEIKQEDSTLENGEDVARKCVGDTSESKVPASDPSKSPSRKPEMVSIETQCDGSGIGPYVPEDDYASIGDDGVPGECLGGCEPGKKPHKCYQCDTSFRTPYELSRHSRVHSGERPYQCRLCHRCFKRKDHVEVHMRRHVEDRRHVCGLCGVCFVTSSCLLRHQRRTHQAAGTKWPGEGEDGEVEGEKGDLKGEGKDQPASRDAQRNGRRNKRNKPDTTYRPGGKTVCIIKKRNLRQRSYSFVELEDDIECFESDEEDSIPFLKVKEQQRVEEREEFGGQADQVDHSLFPGSLFGSEASLGQLLLLGEVSRLLTHSLIPGPLEIPDSQSNVETQAACPWGPEIKENEVDSDDSDCDPPLVACDVTFMEGEGEVTGISQPDDNPATPANPEEVLPQIKESKATSQSGPCQVTLKGDPSKAASGAKETQAAIKLPPSPSEGRLTKPSQPPTGPPFTSPISGRPAASSNNTRLPGTGVGAMGVPRTAWVVPTNNTKGKNTCDACRRRNEANRLAQIEKERLAQVAQSSPKIVESKAEEAPEELSTKVNTKDPPAALPLTSPLAPPSAPPQALPSAPPLTPPSAQPSTPLSAPSSTPPSAPLSTSPTAPLSTPPSAPPSTPPPAPPSTPPSAPPSTPPSVPPSTPPPAPPSTTSLAPPSTPPLAPPSTPPTVPPPAPPPPRTQKAKPTAGKRGRKASSSKKRRQNRNVAVAGGTATAPQRPHKCQLCPFSFRSATELQRHESTHSGERPFLCELCGAGFVRKCHLQLHVRRHSGERRHACQECRMRFFTPSDLARHEAIHQVTDKPLECHLCHLSFRRAFHLERHIRRHNDAAPFACKLCGAFFSSAAALRSHDKHHRMPGPHACPDCTAAFTTATALSRHRRVHSARHQRLLRAVERHATAISSYECVSSEGSPLSLVIRKVAASAGASGEGGTGPAKDSTSDVSSDLAHEGGEEASKADTSTFSPSKEMEEGNASSHSITAGESEEKLEESEIISSGSSSIKDKEDKITSSPSITEKLKKDHKKYTATPLNTVKAKEESQNPDCIPNTLHKVNKSTEEFTSVSLTTKVEEESGTNPSITDVGNDDKLNGRERVIPQLSSPCKESRAMWEKNSDSLIEDTTSAEDDDPYVFKLTASESQIGIKSGTTNHSNKINTKRNKKNSGEFSKFFGTNSGKEICGKSISSFCTTDLETEHIQESGNKVINMEMEHLKESGSLTTCVPAMKENSEQWEGKPECDLFTLSKEKKEAKRGGTCSLLAPNRREMEAVKEIHCRSTYHLTASEGPGNTLHDVSGCPSEQEGSRSSTHDGGQSNNVREGVATTS